MLHVSAIPGKMAHSPKVKKIVNNKQENNEQTKQNGN
jgi:hypothetical protein